MTETLGAASKGTILAVDDDDLLRSTIVAYLEDSGYDVLEAGDGETGLALCRAEVPDALVVDISMPGMSGLELLERLKAEFPQTPVLICSGNGVLQDVVQALRLGAWDYIMKPIPKMAFLENAIEHALERATLLRENRAYQEQLERQTRELADANDSLRAEMEQRQSLQDQLIRSERLAAVGTLAAGVAHQFNNVNTIIMGYADIALEDPALPEHLRANLRTIRGGTERVSTVAKNLLAFTRSRKGPIQPGDVNDVVRDAMDLLERQLDTEGVAHQLTLAETPPVMMDRALLTQVVLNLMVNAHHAMLGRLQRTLSVSTGVDGEAGNVYVRVQDTGCGIPANQVAEIFTPFFSTKGEHCVGKSTQSGVRGTGLGLSVANTIATNHGGGILVESEVDVGSTFTLVTPIAGEAELEAARAKAEASAEAATEAGRMGEAAAGGGDGRRILIVDDEPHILRVFRRMLEGKGFVVTTSPDGNNAMERLLAEDFDLLLVDLVMPTMRGEALIRRMRAELPLEKQPPVVVVTGNCGIANSDPWDMLSGIEVADVLIKPVNRDTLFASLAKALEYPAPIDPPGRSV